MTSVEEDEPTIVERVFEQIGREFPLSPITRSDIKQWIELLEPLLIEHGELAREAQEKAFNLGVEEVTSAAVHIHYHRDFVAVYNPWEKR